MREEERTQVLIRRTQEPLELVQPAVPFSLDHLNSPLCQEPIQFYKLQLLICM